MDYPKQNLDLVHAIKKLTDDRQLRDLRNLYIKMHPGCGNYAFSDRIKKLHGRSFLSTEVFNNANHSLERDNLPDFEEIRHGKMLDAIHYEVSKYRDVSWDTCITLCRIFIDDPPSSPRYLSLCIEPRHLH